jgi:uncharacterized OB-fold protein
MQEFQKPLPEIDEDTKPFWEAVKRHELPIQQCKICGKYPPSHHPIGSAGCPEHGDVNMDWVKASGKGKVFTFVVFQRAFHPAFQADIPYNVSVIELEEGPLIMSNVIDCNIEELKIEMPVEVIFEDVTEDTTIFKFRPAS